MTMKKRPRRSSCGRRLPAARGIPPAPLSRPRRGPRRTAALANDNELAARYDMVREELGEAGSALNLAEARCAIGARDAEPFPRQDRRRAGPQAEGIVQHARRLHRFRHQLPAAHAGLWRDRGGSRDRSAGRASSPVCSSRKVEVSGSTYAGIADDLNEQASYASRSRFNPQAEAPPTSPNSSPTTRPPSWCARRPSECSRCAYCR